MKKCPFCGAEIEENARFCLYCMTPLQEKQLIPERQKQNKRWIIILSSALLSLLIGISVWFIFTNPLKSDNSSRESSSKSDTPGVQDDAVYSDEEETGGKPAVGADDENDTVGENNDTGGNDNSSGNQASGSSGGGSSSEQSGYSQESSSGGDGISQSQQTAVNEAVYTYRAAKYGDDFSVHTDIPDDAIVITGVASASESGLYTIPESIDGKTVFAVMGTAFSDENISSTVKKVVVPSSVKTIWNFAFANCYNMTDIYLCGSSVYIEAQAFCDEEKRSGTLTIHCFADCSDRNLRLYKNSATLYGAKYEEWDGGAYN